MAGDRETAAAYVERVRAAAESLAEDDDRELLAQDLGTLGL
jgi:hypothetical protein